MMKIVDETIEDIRDTITDLMFALNDKSEVAKRLVDEDGAALLDVIKKAQDNLGKKDVRFCGKPSLDKQLHSFVQEASKIDSFYNDNGEKRNIKHLKMATELLNQFLSQSWNTSLEADDELEMESNECSTPQKSDNRVVLKIVSPHKKDAITQFKCNTCEKSFTNAEYLGKHSMQAHGVSQTVDEPLVTCPLLTTKAPHKVCNSQLTLRGMYRHLKDSHGIQKDSPKHYLKYFKSTDGGKTFTSVVFLRQSDPVPNEMIVENIADIPKNEGKEAYVGGEEPEVDEATDSTETTEATEAPEDTETAEEGAFNANEANQTQDQDIATAGGEADCYNDVSNKETKRSECQELKELPLDSDVETDDEDTYTNHRLQNKLLRYRNRENDEENPSPLFEDPDNKCIVEEFETFMRDVKSRCDKGPGDKKIDTPTTTKYVNYLFKHPKCFLNYETSKNEKFKLKKMVQFDDQENFIPIKAPIEWLNDVAGESQKDEPDLRKEMMKAHASFRSFLIYKLQATDMGSDLMSLTRKREIKENINEVDETLKRMNTWSKIQLQVKNKKFDKDRNKELLNPSNNMNEVNSVKCWFQSPQFREMFEEKKNIFDKAMAENKISNEDFVNFGLFTRLILMLMDKNRTGGFDFTNSHVICAQKLWFPINHPIGEDVPDDWDYHTKPDDGRDHDGYQIKISPNSLNLKLATPITITVHGYGKNLLDKYKQLKKLVFDEVDTSAPFFVNGAGNKLSPLKNTKGSLLDIFSQVTGVVHATVNSIRRGFEHSVQTKESSRKRIQLLQGHNVEVGLSHYHKLGGDIRSGATFSQSQVEGSSQADFNEEESDEIAAKKAKLDEEENNLRKKIIQKALDEETKSRYTLGKTMKLLPAHRKFVQKLLTDEKYFHLHNIR